MILPFNYFPEKNTPRPIIFGIDMCISFFSIVLAYLLRFNFAIPQLEMNSLHVVIPIVLLVRGTSFLSFKTYAGIIRYTSTKDAQRIFIAISVGSIIFGIANWPAFYI